MSAITDTVAEVKQKGKPYARKVLEVDLRKIDRVIPIVLVLLGLLLLAETISYDNLTPQIGPYFLLSIVLGLLVILIVRQAGYLGNSERVIGEPDNFVGGFGGSDENEADAAETETRSLFERRVELVRTVLWVLFLFVGSWLFGIANTSTVFLLLFLRYEAKESWLLTLTITVVTMGFIVFIFQNFLGGALYPGIFEISVFDYLPI